MNKAWASREQSLGIERTDFGHLVPIMRATSAQNKLQELGNILEYILNIPVYLKNTPAKVQ